MASALYILDSKGSPLITRTYRGDVGQNVQTVFAKRVLDEEEFSISPVFEEHGYTYAYIRENDVYIVMVSKINVVPLEQLAFMRRCVTVFETYFKKVTEEHVRDNFVIIYELLDEMCDFGYPQFTEEKVLKEYITQEGLIAFLLPDDQLDVKQLPAAVTGVGGATPWRMPGKYYYRRNEVFLDVVEKVNLLVSQEGETLSSEIIGALKMRVRLSGMPTLKLGLNDRVLFASTGRTGQSVELSDIKFHQCVKLNRFEAERVITFIPPDGDFEVMTYRLNKKIPPLVQVSVSVVRHGTTRVEMFIKASSAYRRSSTANFVEIQIPIPSDVVRPEAVVTLGSIKYAPESNILLWTLRALSGGKEFSCRCQFHLPSVRSTEAAALSKAPIVVKFDIPYLTASGFQVRYLKVTEKSNYEALPWVRYVTQNGEYQIRTN